MRLEPRSVPPVSPSPSRIHRLVLLLVLSISAFIQFTVVSRTVMDVPLRSDARDYFSYAYNLSNHGTYSRTPSWETAAPQPRPIPDSLRPPGYPLFLLALGSPEPSDQYFRRIRLTQALLGVASVLLTYLIAAQLVGGWWAVSAALFTSLSPHLATISTNILGEALFTFLLLGSVYASIQAIRGRNYWRFAVAGALWGLCSLVRSTTLLLPVLMLVALFCAPTLRSLRRAGGLFLLCYSLTLSPWLVRNHFVGVERQAPGLMVTALAHGSYPDFMYEGFPQSFGFPYRFDPLYAKFSKDLPSVLRHISEQFVSHPIRSLRWYLIGKPLYLLKWNHIQGYDILIHPVIHTPYYEDSRFALIRSFSLILHWPLMILGLAGTWLALVRGGPSGVSISSATSRSVVALVVVYALAFHMIVAPFPRYGLPFRPLLFILAMYSASVGWSVFRGRATRMGDAMRQ